MTDSAALPFVLERELLLRAPRSLVFSYFTDSARWARWWGEGSTIEGRPGGAVHIVQPGGAIASGEVLEIRPDEQIVFTYGYPAEDAPIPPGGSIVTITLRDEPGGTHLHLRHDVPGERARDLHVQGWRFQLSVFANVVADDALPSAAALADAWFEAWNATDAPSCREKLAPIAADDVVFLDRYSSLQGIDDVVAHIEATRVHMPGVILRREGDPRHCQGTVVAGWIARSDQGKTLATGTNVFEINAAGRCRRVVGLWNE